MKAARKFLLLLCCVLVCVLAVHAQNGAAERYDLTCQIARDGAQDWTLTVTMAPEDEPETLALPLPGVVTRLKVAGPDHELTQEEDGTWLLTLLDPEGFSGQKTFVITWRTPSTLSDSQAVTLTLPLLSSRWSWDIDALSFDVTLPAPVEDPGAVCESGYYGELYPDEVDLTVSEARVAGTWEDVMAYDALTLRLSLPEGYFSVPSGLWRYLRSVPGIVNLLALGLLLGSVLYWLRRYYTGSLRVRSRPLPPDGATSADLPYLLDGENPDLTALLLEWAAAGYLVIYQKGRQVVLRRRMLMGNERNAYELDYFETLFRNGTVCQLPDSQIRRSQARARKALRRTWRRQIFDRKGGQVGRLKLLSALTLGTAGVPLVYSLLPEGAWWTVLSLLCLLPVALAGLWLQHVASQLLLRPTDSKSPAVLSYLAAALLGAAGFLWGAWVLLLAVVWQLLVGLQTAFGEKRTKTGRDYLGQVLSLRKYLLTVSQEELRLRLRQDPMYYYRLLPWAKALGLGRDFSHRFGRLRMEAADWFNTGRSQQTADEFYDALEPVLERLER